MRIQTVKGNWVSCRFPLTDFEEDGGQGFLYDGHWRGLLRNIRFTFVGSAEIYGNPPRKVFRLKISELLRNAQCVYKQ